MAHTTDWKDILTDPCHQYRKSMELQLNQHLAPFDLETTLCCGQVFRWEKHDSWWYGIVNQCILKVRQKNDRLQFKGVDAEFLKSLFRLDDNLPQIIIEINKDSLIRQATREFPGLRLARQDPWQCLISYICATVKNIPAIKLMISELSKRFGRPVFFDNRQFYTFPTHDVLTKASLADLRKCKLGFRANWIRKAARLVSDEEIDFEALKLLNYKLAKERLLQVPGVGNKVADCVLLFALEKLEAFPIDIWMKRIIQNHYANHFDVPFIDKLAGTSTLSRKTYDKIGDFARNYFGKFAGYAQEYLFHFARNNRTYKSNLTRTNSASTSSFT